MKHEIEIAEVDGLGTVTADVSYQVQGDGTPVNRHITGAVYGPARTPVPDEWKERVGETFNAFYG